MSYKVRTLILVVSFLLAAFFLLSLTPLSVPAYAGISTPSPSPSPSPEAQADHLLCYKVKDLAVHPTVQNLGVDLTTIQFGELTCKIVGNYREFCVPTNKEIVGDQDAEPAQASDGTPLEDRICYEVRGCTGAVPPAIVNVLDQLGQRDITFLSGSGRQKTPPAPYTLCTPAEKCNSACIEYGEGSACDLGDDMDSEEGVCEDLCRCVRCGDDEERCCSGDECNGGLTCDEGTCRDCGDLGEDCCSDNKCNSDESICLGNTCEHCGDFEEQCCSGDTCNSSSLTCLGNTCEPCGDYGDPCCSGDMCNSDNLICQGGNCDLCGESDQRCCSGDTCNSDNLICQGGTCTECGDENKPCCVGDGPECNSNELICDAGQCVSCGHMGDVSCCAGDTCVSPSAVCINDKCEHCGGDGDPCCENDMCSESDLVCNSINECEQCGGMDQPCCLGNNCQGTFECISGTCQET
jgi:hypothetical protein